MVTIPIVFACIRPSPICCINRIFAASTEWIVLTDDGFALASRCRSKWVVLDCPWRCTHGTLIRCGCFRWTARRSGFASVPAEDPQLMSHATAGKRGCVKMRAFRNLKFVDRQTSGDDRRCSRPGWPLSRSNQRGNLREFDRRPPMAVFDTTFAGSVCRGSWVVVLIVSIPTSLRSYTDQ